MSMYDKVKSQLFDAIETVGVIADAAYKIEDQKAYDKAEYIMAKINAVVDLLEASK